MNPRVNVWRNAFADADRFLVAARAASVTMREDVIETLITLLVLDLFENRSALASQRDGDLHVSLVIVPVTAPS